MSDLTHFASVLITVGANKKANSGRMDINGLTVLPAFEIMPVLCPLFVTCDDLV